MRKRTRKTVGRGAKVVEKVHGFPIREVRPGYFFVQVRRRGLNVAKGFTSLDAAKLKCEEWHTKLTNEGLAGFSITEAERLDAQKALKTLNGRSTLADVAEYWTKHHPDNGALTLKELVQKHVADLEARNCRPLTIKERRQRLNRLCADLGDRPAASILTGDLQEWLNLRGGGPVNRNNLRRSFSALFNYGLAHGIVTSNPAERISVPKADEKMPVFFPVATVEKLLRYALANKPRIVPFLALGAFAGLRPDEARGLLWENVNFAARHIRVMPETSKTRRARLVPISSNLRAWLAAHKKDAGPVGVPLMTETRDRRDCMTGIGLSRWPVDVLRHTYATFELARHPDVAALAESMGNSPSIIYRHYKGLATPKEARAYFALKPQENKSARNAAKA